MSEVSAVGIQLRQHRKQRGMSQLHLAHAANSTSRHISFVETGRSRPGRELILRLANALNLTLRDSNDLLKSAGLPAAFTERTLSDDEMRPVKRLIDQIIRNHDPFPAWVVGAGLQFLASNHAAERVFPGMVGMKPSALIDLWCAPTEGISEDERKYIVYQTLHGLRRETFHYPHPILPSLLKQAEGYAEALGPGPMISDSPVLCPTINVAGHCIRTLSTVMRFDKAVDVTMSEVRVELVYPADEESERIFRDLARD